MAQNYTPEKILCHIAVEFGNLFFVTVFQARRSLRPTTKYIITLNSRTHHRLVSCSRDRSKQYGMCAVGGRRGRMVWREGRLAPGLYWTMVYNYRFHFWIHSVCLRIRRGFLYSIGLSIHETLCPTKCDQFSRPGCGDRRLVHIE